MLTKDLTQSYPRSVREKVLGIVQLARAIDKGIATANGTNGEYNFDCPMDKHLFEFLGFEGRALLDVIKRAGSENEILAYVKPYVERKPAAELEAFNADFLQDGPQPGSPGMQYFLSLREAAAPHRTDVTTWADLLDLDEKREVPRRPVAA